MVWEIEAGFDGNRDAEHERGKGSDGEGGGIGDLGFLVERDPSGGFAGVAGDDGDGFMEDFLLGIWIQHGAEGEELLGLGHFHGRIAQAHWDFGLDVPEVFIEEFLGDAVAEGVFLEAEGFGGVGISEAESAADFLINEGFLKESGGEDAVEHGGDLGKFDAGFKGGLFFLSAGVGLLGVGGRGFVHQLFELSQHHFHQLRVDLVAFILGDDGNAFREEGAVEHFDLLSAGMAGGIGAAEPDVERLKEMLETAATGEVSPESRFKEHESQRTNGVYFSGRFGGEIADLDLDQVFQFIGDGVFGFVEEDVRVGSAPARTVGEDDQFPTGVAFEIEAPEWNGRNGIGLVISGVLFDEFGHFLRLRPIIIIRVIDIARVIGFEDGSDGGFIPTREGMGAENLSRQFAFRGMIEDGKPFEVIQRGVGIRGHTPILVRNEFGQKGGMIRP